eukprot:JP448472.1.p2 GENE.JP448472.1~~JP448472.1.p2  ORF type:complete len:92 (+),score=45.60 JP448472.1:1-276(+)
MGRIPILNKKDDLCQLFKMGGSSCPVPAGAFSKSITETIPSYAPTGTYNIHAQAWDASGNEIFCLETSVKVAKNAVLQHFEDDDALLFLAE